MEAEYVRERRRRRTIVILGVILAILAAGATYYLVTRPGGGGQGAAQKTIVVAAVDIAERSVIDAADVRTIQVADSAGLATVATDTSRVIGQTANIRIAANTPIFTGMYGQGTAGGLAIIPQGEELTADSPAWRAVSVLVPDERAVGGLVQRGDRVDLFATMEIRVFDAEGESTDSALLPQGYYSDFTTKVTWTNLEVLSTDRNNELYVLRVDQHQAEEIAHIQGMGVENSFTMSLRAQADAREIDRSTYGETTGRIIEQYNYPIPQIIFLDSYPQPTFAPNQPPAPAPSVPPASSPAPVEPSPTASP